MKRLSESREIVVVLEPVLRACLLPLVAHGAKGFQNGSQAVWGEPGSRFWNTSPKQQHQTTMSTLQAPGGTKTIHSFCSVLREHICCLNTQSGPRSQLKRLSESREVVAVLEPVLRACLLPLVAPKTAPKPFWVSQEAVLDHQSKTTTSSHTADLTSSRWHKHDTLVL